MDKTKTITNKNSLVKLLENKQACNQIVMWKNTFLFFRNKVTERDKIMAKRNNIEIRKYLKQTQRKNINLHTS